MTEAEWLTCDNMKTLVDFFQANARERKQWLFACACCHGVWHLLSKGCRRGVEMVEFYADAEVGEEELVTQFNGFYPLSVATAGLVDAPGSVQAACAVGYLGMRWRNLEQDQWRRTRPGAVDARAVSYSVSRNCAESLAQSRYWEDARGSQAVLLRDIFGNPFRPATISAMMLRWNDSTLPKIACAIYEDRAFDRMPILADALEDAGCDNADILRHCREAGEHVRGCWVIDLLLGKE